MTSHGEKLSLAAFWQDSPNADRKGREWLSGPSISKEDLERGSVRIERCTAAGWWGGFQRVVGTAAGGATPRGGPVTGGEAAVPANRQQDRQISVPRSVPVPRDQGVIRGGGTGNPSRPQAGLLMTFGRHRGELAANVREDDPGYWRWAVGPEGPSWFRNAAAKAGLLEDDNS